MERFLFQFILLSSDGAKVDFQECHIYNSLTSAKEALNNFNLEQYGMIDIIDGKGTCNQHIRFFKWEGEDAVPNYRDAYLTISIINVTPKEYSSDDEPILYKIEIQRDKFGEPSEKETHLNNLTLEQAKRIFAGLYEDVMAMANNNIPCEYLSSDFNGMQAYVVYKDKRTYFPVVCGWKGMIIKMIDRVERED